MNLNDKGIELDDSLLDGVSGGRAIYYTIHPGETLARIANRFGTSVRKLCEMNNIENPDMLEGIEQLRIK